MASPIEEALRRALIACAPERRILVDATGHPSALAEGWIEPSVWLLDDDHRSAIYLYRDVAILTYRADFVLEVGRRRLVVECNGHDFHDRTKQQAAYDRARDRELLCVGTATIRFTGSEIMHSPERCAGEAYRSLFALPDTAAFFEEGWHLGHDAAVTRAEHPVSVEEHW